MYGRTPGTAAARGFTLVELMVVIIIVGMIGTVAVMSWASVLPKQKFHAAIRNLSEVLYETRSEAIARNRTFSLEYDLDEDAYRVFTPYRMGGGFALALDDPERLWTHQTNLREAGIDLLELNVDDRLVTDGKYYVDFQPLGMATYHTVLLKNGELGLEYTLEVLPLTGEIRLHEGAFKRPLVDEGDFR